MNKVILDSDFDHIKNKGGRKQVILDPIIKKFTQVDNNVKNRD